MAGEGKILSIKLGVLPYLWNGSRQFILISKKVFSNVPLSSILKTIQEMISESSDTIHTETKNNCMLAHTSQICLPAYFFSSPSL